VQRHSRVSIGRNTKLRWWRLRSLRGGRLSIGCDSIVHCRIDFDSEGANVRIGSRCYLGASHLVCHTAIDVGDDVIMSWGVTIVDHDSHSPHWHERQHDVGDWMQGRKRWDAIRIAPVIIEAKVWIGFGAAILRGVTIGEGAVVGACSVVTRDVPPYTVVAGNPARVVRRLDLPQA
jgi:galactoside O-acetyltransferase